MTQGKLITFEGIECSGKGTQIKFVAEWLNELGIKHACEHEPGGTLYGEALRTILKNPELSLPAIFSAIKDHSDYQEAKRFEFNDETDYSRNGMFEVFLFMASRSLYAEKVKRLLQGGTTVISDRLMDSSTAYQGGGKNNNNPQVIENIYLCNKMAMGELWPDLTLFLDISVDEMYKRMSMENDEKNSFFEKKYDRAFYERVRQGYLDIAKREPERFIVLDGSKTPNEVFEDVKTRISKVLNLQPNQ